jgi:methylated-DNA-[protein]-cysteine S-methyltransferase
MIRIDSLETPIGLLWLAAAGDELVEVTFDAAPAGVPQADPLGATSRLRAYFDGDLDAIERLPARAAAGSPFQRRVWEELRRIPRGTTRSYGEVAARIGRPGAGRAVGMANHRNPLGVVVPCHRVVGADGSLTGYAGGLQRKRWLLIHEGALAAATPQLLPFPPLRPPAPPPRP